MTVAILAAFCQGETRIMNVANLREGNRSLAGPHYWLRKLGVQVTEFPDGLQINGHPETLHGAEIATYDDHRMAMCFGMAGARLPGIRIQEPWRKPIQASGRTSRVLGSTCSRCKR